MTTATDGWAGASVGGKARLLHTSDGAKTWVDVTPAGLTGLAGYLQLPSSSPTAVVTGWVANSSQHACVADSSSSSLTVFCSDDGGAHWSQALVQVASSDSGPLQMMSQTDAVGYLLIGPEAMGQQARALYATSDGGASWRLVASKLSISALVGVFGAGALVGVTPGLGDWSVSSRGRYPFGLSVSTDGGKTWRAARVPVIRGTTTVTTVGPGRVVGSRWLLPVRYDTGLAVLSTSDGSSWSAGDPLPSSADQPGFWGFGAAGAVWAVLGQTLSRSTNGGQSWESSAFSVPGPLGWLQFFGDRHGFALAATGAGQTLYRTSDFGTAWQAVP